MRRFVMVLAVGGAVACAGPITALHTLPTTTQHQVVLCDAGRPCTDTVSVTYLGVDGFLIRSGRSALLTAPSFTHPGLSRTVFGLTVRADTAHVDSLIHRVDTRDVRAILVGHSHYDHLLDVPYLARRVMPGAQVIGTPSMRHILAGDSLLPRERVVALADSAVGDSLRAGDWHYVPEPSGAPPRFRVMALESRHAPNVWILSIAPWLARSDYTSLPRSAWGWRRGEVYAYLIDVVRPDSTPAFRIFYHDAAADPRWTTVPPLPARDRRRVDLALLCAGNFENVQWYPTALLAGMRPRYSLVGHWENFFESTDAPLQVIPFTDTRELERRMNAVAGEGWSSLVPFDSVRFRH